MCIRDRHAVYTGVVPIMLNKIAANEQPVINGDGSQAYDFIYVEDVARCNVLSAISDINFGMYNVGTAVSYTHLNYKISRDTLTKPDYKNILKLTCGASNLAKVMR